MPPTRARATLVWHIVEGVPLRVSALRGLGAYMNVFTIENATDEPTARAGVDPVEFRLRHLADERARAVADRAALRSPMPSPTPSAAASPICP